MHTSKILNNHNSATLEAANINNTSSRQLNSINENHSQTNPNIKHEESGSHNGPDKYSTYLIKERASNLSSN